MTLFSRIAFAGGLLVSALLFGGCATTDDTTFFPTGEATNAAPAQLARFQVGDTVTITLSGGPVGEDPAPITESVKDDGTITMPDIGKV